MTTASDRGWSLGARELLLLAPGSYFGISNFVQHAAASGGFGSRLHAVLGFALLFAAFNLAAAGPMAARRLHRGDLSHSRLIQIVGHLLIIGIGVTAQFFAVACAVVFIREPVFALSAAVALHTEILVECWPIWICVYAFLVAVDSYLSHQQPGAATAVADESGLADAARFVFHADGVDHIVDPEDIRQIRAMGDYVRIHTGRRTIVVKATLADIETKLAGHGLLRVHRSALVRASAICEIVRGDTGAYEATLSCGAIVPLSRRRLDEVRSTIARVHMRRSSTAVDRSSKSL